MKSYLVHIIRVEVWGIALHSQSVSPERKHSVTLGFYPCEWSPKTSLCN